MNYAVILCPTSSTDEERLMVASYILLVIVLGGSAYVWSLLVWQWQRHESPLPLNPQPRAEWKSAPELIVVYVTLLWIAFHLLVQFSGEQPATSAESPNVKSLLIQAALNCGLALVLPLAMMSPQRPPTLLGITTLGLCDQIRIGVKSYFAAAVPMMISIVVTFPFRRGTQHPLLTSLADSPDVITVLLIFVLAAISASLLEEMLFRVILQGWLETLLPSPVAIAFAAFVFSLVHGWRNGIALLPLALILGYVFHRRHSYVAVVVIHSLFNATMIALQLLRPEVST